MFLKLSPWKCHKNCHHLRRLFFKSTSTLISQSLEQYISQSLSILWNFNVFPYQRKFILSWVGTGIDNAADENDAVYAAIDDDATSDVAGADVDAYFEGYNLLAGDGSIASCVPAP